jgi:hypothetical protein
MYSFSEVNHLKRRLAIIAHRDIGDNFLQDHLPFGELAVLVLGILQLLPELLHGGREVHETEVYT